MDLLLKEDSLVEEQTRRSILVTNIPANFTYKDVIIYFQKERNGGGEVDSAMYPEPRDLSSVVITFEDPKTVDLVISRSHNIGGQDVTVQRYPILIPEVFDVVHARFNPQFFSSHDSLQKVLEQLRRDFSVTVEGSHIGNIYITGSLEMIQMCQNFVLETISNHEQCTNLQEDQVGAAGVTRQRNQEDYHKLNEEIYEPVFETVPVILQFVLTVSKYKSKLAEIEQHYNVSIRPSPNYEKVAIKASENCTKEQHEEACEEFITLYRRVFDAPMTSKEIKLHPGPNSMYHGAKEAVDEILQLRPVIIQETDTKEWWLFYGEEKYVKAAIKEVCAILKIDHPFKRSSKQLDELERKQITENTALSAEIDTDKKDFQERSTRANEKDIPSNRGAIYREEFLTKKGFKLSVSQGDITEEQVDAIVNYNDEYLRGFASGLPKRIVQKGGRDIEYQAVAQSKKRVTKAGNIIVTGAGGSLRCLKVMHIITPNIKKSKDVLKNMIKDACLDCLRKTQSRDLKSIAFPVYNSNKSELSLPHCATAMVNAVEEYMRTGDPKKKAVSDIRFVHKDSTAFQVFTQEFKKRYGESYVKPSREQAKDQHGKPHDGSYSTGPRVNNPTDKSKTSGAEKDVCPICLDDLTDQVTLQICKHQFCKSCIELAFKHNKKCPTCGVAYGVQTGNMPQGSMSSRRDRMSLPGHSEFGTISISYSFPSGVQGPEHPNPGQYYTGTSRTAYLPDNPEGREVLKLLKKAFDARLTFTIGTSVTTGATNTVTWNDIHHKTNTRGGPTQFGYPDPGYLKRVKEELAAKGIS